MSTETITELSRVEKLQVWMTRNGQTFRSLGREIDMSGSCLGRLLRGESMPSWRHRQLLDLGVPEALLPPALDIKPGPKPRAETAEAAA